MTIAALGGDAWKKLLFTVVLAVAVILVSRIVRWLLAGVLLGMSKDGGRPHNDRRRARGRGRHRLHADVRHGDGRAAGMLHEDPEVEARVYYRLTDNWIELTLRFATRVHGIRPLKDAMFRDILAEFQKAGLGIASSTYDIVGLPPIRITSMPEQAPRAKQASGD